MKRNISTILLLVCMASGLSAQQALPKYDKATVMEEGDWLVKPVSQTTQLYQDDDGYLVLSNGIVSRTFATNPNGATVGLEHLQTNESFLRSVRPEAELQIDGMIFEVGGLKGQPIHNYLLPEWLDEMTTNPSAFQLLNYEVGPTKERFPWKKRMEWMPKDMPWPAPGKELVFNYRLHDDAIKRLVANWASDESRAVIFTDQFESLSDNWKRFESQADDRNSFINEGKAGEIMALANTAVYAEQAIDKEAQVYCQNQSGYR